jgi:hypothetical protein
MKTVKVKSFENPFVNKGIEYVCCPCLDINKSANEKITLGFKTIKVQIALHKNLRGRTDLHGRPYQPSEFLFVSSTKI